jgi:ribonuclease HI
MDLHAAIWFTHAFATDGSKHRDGRTAFGIWSGARLREQGAHEEEGLRMLQAEPGMEERATGRGMEGGRLPATWEVMDAEMYAVFRALLRVYLETRSAEGAEAVSAKRILILSDCQSAIKEIERAWREGEVRHETNGDRRALLEAICRIRAHMGIVVIMYVPAHTGCSPNEYADASAKAHLDADLEDATNRVAKWNETRPRICEWWTSEGWVMSDLAMYSGTRKRATEHIREHMEKGVEKGRITAGQEGAIWKELGARALRMTKAQVTEKSTITKPTWEDVQTHNQCVGVIMGLRNGDTIGVTHEQTWERRKRSEGAEGGSATRCGEWGCAACLRARREITAGGGQVPDDAAPLATMRHWLTGRCAGTSVVIRKEVAEGMKDIFKAVKNLKGEGAKEVKAVCVRAMAAANRAVQGDRVTDMEWQAYAQVMSAQLPNIPEASTKLEKEIDGRRRQLVHLVLDLKHTAIETGRKAETWKREREEHRGWSKLVIRAWRDAAVGHAQRIRLDKLTEGEAQAKAESARTKRRAMMTIAEGRGATRRLRRMSTEVWWAKLGQKIRAIATWARLVRGTTAIWYVNGKGRGLTAEVETAEGSDTAGENDTTAGVEGRQRQVEGRRRGRAQTAVEGVKEGIRLWWWLEDGEGHNAKGPGSVTGRRRERTACTRRPP